MLRIICLTIIGVVSSQQIGPIVPMNRNFYGSPYQAQQYQPFPSQAQQYQPFSSQNQQYPIHPINGQQSYSGFGAHDLMSPYRPSAIHGVSSFAQPPGTFGMSN
jgi:hypothetical protein